MLYSNQRLQRWCFDVELLYLAQKAGIPVSEIAVTWAEIPGKQKASLPCLNTLETPLSICLVGSDRC